jgi:hypothetical protein
VVTVASDVSHEEQEDDLVIPGVEAYLSDLDEVYRVSCLDGWAAQSRTVRDGSEDDAGPLTLF